MLNKRDNMFQYILRSQLYKYIFLGDLGFRFKSAPVYFMPISLQYLCIKKRKKHKRNSITVTYTN